MSYPTYLSDYESTLITLAEEYHTACVEVQKTWSELLTTSPQIGESLYDALRKRARGEYAEATRRARDARDKLLIHASRGASEVGT